MVEVWLPYGATEVSARIPAENYAGILNARDVAKPTDARLAVQKALSDPLGAQPLRKLLGPDTSAVIQVNVANPRPVHDLLLPSIIEELRAAGARDENVKVVATAGVTPPLGLEDAKSRLGRSVAGKFTVIRHDPGDNGALVSLGETRRGTPVYLNRGYLESDVKILTGEVGFHAYAGYSGGRESVALDLSGVSTLTQLHGLLPSGESHSGVLGTNPVHEDMSEIAGLAPPAFTVNVIRDVSGNIVTVLAGEMGKVLEEGIKVVESFLAPSLPDQVDVVVASPGGNPHDANLSAAIGALENALSIVKPGGVVVLVAECQEGYGSRGFHEWLKRYRDFRALERAIRREWEFGAEEAFLLRRGLQSVRVILVSALPDLYAVETYGLRTAPTASSAVDLALRIVGRRGRFAAIPYASVIHPRRVPSAETEASASA